MKLQSFIAAAALAVAATGAHATIDSGNTNLPTGGNGEFIFVAYDTVAKHSFIQDSGIRFQDLLAAKAALKPLSFVVNSTNFTKAFGSDLTNVVWNVYAGSNQINVGETPNYGAIIDTAGSVQDAIDNKIDAKSLDSLVLQIANNLITKNQSAVGDTSPTSVNNSYVVLDGTKPAYAGVNWGNSYAGKTNQNSSVNVVAKELFDEDGNSLGLENNSAYLLQYGRVRNTGPDSAVNQFVSTVSYFSRATFDASTGTVNINTPVPAAAWLLVSGLAGFGAISRRRKQQA